MSEWQPIETAPKDGSNVLGLMGGKHVSVCRWDDQRFHNAPRPLWMCELGYIFGKRWERENQPTHWMPLPEPPASPSPSSPRPE